MKNKMPHFLAIQSQGTSMMPLIQEKAVMILDTRPKQHYTVGDVVAYLNPGGNSTVHRIISSITLSSGSKKFLLKGDANRISDGMIDRKNIFGKVQTIRYPSYTIDLTTPLSFGISKIIAYCGNMAMLHPRIYVVERISTLCLTKIFIGNARGVALISRVWSKMLGVSVKKHE